MHVAFALFADAANLSQEGKLNILGVFDALQVGTLPSLHPRATLVVHLKGTALDVGSHKVTLNWLSPSGNELWSSEGELGVATPPQGVLEMDFPLIAQLTRGPRSRWRCGRRAYRRGWRRRRQSGCRRPQMPLKYSVLKYAVPGSRRTLPETRPVHTGTRVK